MKWATKRTMSKWNSTDSLSGEGANRFNVKDIDGKPMKKKNVSIDTLASNRTEEVVMNDSSDEVSKNTNMFLKIIYKEYKICKVLTKNSSNN